MPQRRNSGRTPLATVNLVTTAPLTLDELRLEVEAVLAPYGMPVDEFVASDVDDLPSDDLRDLSLTVKGALLPAE